MDRRYLPKSEETRARMSKARLSYWASKTPGRTLTEDLRLKLEECSMPVSETGCWLWLLSCLSTNGYGQIAVARKMFTAHRVSYETFIGPIPRGMHVLHRCDTPSCINPAHLFLGTQAENNADMRAKQRIAHGETNSNAKLDEGDVRQIRQLREGGVSYPRIAKMFKICDEQARRICLRENWKHVP